MSKRLRQHPKTTHFARRLRTDATDAEQRLWSRLRQSQLAGYRFRRQRPIGPYIADFACLSPRLVVELDGDQHAKRKSYDQRRDAYLRSQGFKVLRFDNHTALTETDAVLDTILNTLNQLQHEQSQSPPRGGDVTK